MCRPSLCKPPNLFCGHESDPDITAVAWLKNTRWWVHLKVGGGRLVLYLATHVHWHMLRDLRKQDYTLHGYGYGYSPSLVACLSRLTNNNCVKRINITHKNIASGVLVYLTWKGLLIRMVAILHCPQATVSKSISSVKSWRAGFVTVAESTIEYTGPLKT